MSEEYIPEIKAADGWTPKEIADVTATDRKPISMPAAEFDAKGRFEKMKLATQENMGSSGVIKKGFRALGTAVGAWYAGKGGINFIKHLAGGTKQDANGNEVPSTGSDLVVDALQFGGGAAAVYLSLVAGGREKIISGHPAPSLSI